MNRNGGGWRCCRGTRSMSFRNHGRLDCLMCVSAVPRALAGQPTKMPRGCAPICSSGPRTAPRCCLPAARAPPCPFITSSRHVTSREARQPIRRWGGSARVWVCLCRERVGVGMETLYRRIIIGRRFGACCTAYRYPGRGAPKTRPRTSPRTNEEFKSWGNKGKQASAN